MQINGSAITIHGREAMYLTYLRYATIAGVRTQVDISASSIFFEVDSVLRKQLVIDPNDQLGLVIELTLEEVDMLPISTSNWITRDETGAFPSVECSGTIKRVGWVEVPPSV